LRNSQNPPIRQNGKAAAFCAPSPNWPTPPGHPALKAGAAHKKRFEAWLADVLTREGVDDAATIARRIVILLDGAATVMLIHRDPAYVEAAGEVAAALVQSARKPDRGSRRSAQQDA